MQGKVFHCGWDRISARTSSPLKWGIIEVEEHNLDVRLAPEDLERLAPIVREAHPKGSLLQLHLDDTPDVRLVVGDQRMNRLHSRSPVG